MSVHQDRGALNASIQAVELTRTPTSRWSHMPIFATNVSTTEFTPHPKNDEHRNELVHYLRRSTGSWTTLRAGMVIAEPQEGIIGDGLGDDTVFVYEGVAEVRTVEGE